MKKAAVIGYPISHSLSPILHGFLLQKYNITGSYEAIAITQDELSNTIDDLLFNKQYQGFNVTIPHKEEIFKIFSERNYQITDKALLTGAINTVYKIDDQVIGSNSDIYGFEKNLTINLPSNSSKNKALIIGAGGVASSAIFSLASIYKEIYIINRSPKRAITLANNISNSLTHHHNIAQISAITKIDSDLHSDLDLIVNCTSIGMSNKNEHFIDIDQINNNCIVYDLVYNPLMTDILQKAKNSHKPFITGIGMLIYQAFEGFEKWFGIKPELNKSELEALTNSLISNIK